MSELADTLERVATLATVLLVEQNLAVVRRLAQRIVVLDHGEVVHTGDAIELEDPDLAKRFLGVTGVR